MIASSSLYVALNFETQAVSAPARASRRFRLVFASRFGNTAGATVPFAPAGELPASLHRIRFVLEYGRSHYKLPRSACSRSMASNSALKLPLPKLFAPLR